MRRMFAYLVMLALVTGLVLVAVHAASAASSNDRVIEAMIRAKFGAAHDDTAVCLAAAESAGSRSRPYHFDRWAHSPTNDDGVFQIHGGRDLYGRRIYDVAFNIDRAYIKSHGGTNWWPWTGTYGRGMCHGLT